MIAYLNNTSLRRRIYVEILFIIAYTKADSVREYEQKQL